MKNILVIGATSLIAEECCKIWSEDKCKLFLVGRNKDRLNSISKDLTIRNLSKINIFQSDLSNIQDHEKIFKKALKFLKKIDIILIAHGSLSNEEKGRNDVLYALKELNLNALSFISLLIIASKYFKDRKNGTIAVLSSVASERGKSSNYLYGSAKSMIKTYCSGLRQYLFRFNVSVVTINLGFVDTPMTRNFKKNFLWANAGQVAHKVVKAIYRKKDIVYIPKFWIVIMFFIKLMPEKLFKRFKL